MPIIKKTHGKENKQLSLGILRDVARSFYLTLKILPEDLQKPLCNAYLLARMADMIADTRIIQQAQRLKLLQSFRQSFTDAKALQSLQDSFKAFINPQLPEAEQRLLKSLAPIAEVYAELSPSDYQLTFNVLSTLVRGMEMDLRHFPMVEAGTIAALESEDQLDDYIYHVAGCVGEYWTELLINHKKSLQKWDKIRMIDLGVQYGKALQLTNVLRDLPHDLHMGRCYLPLMQLSQVKLSPEDLLDAKSVTFAQPVFNYWLNLAMGYYQAAEQYFLAIPRRFLRLRLACLWPMLIGLATLAKIVSRPNWLAPESPAKLSRIWIYRMLFLSGLCFYSNTLCRLWIRWLTKRVNGI